MAYNAQKIRRLQLKLNNMKIFAILSVIALSFSPVQATEEDDLVTKILNIITSGLKKYFVTIYPFDELIQIKVRIFLT